MYFSTYSFVIGTNCLTQVVTLPTRLSNILDIFLTSVPKLVSDYKLCDPLGSSHKDSLLIDISIPAVNSKLSNLVHSVKTKLILWNCDSIALAQNCLLNYNWSIVFDINSTSDTVWHNLSSVVNSCVDAFAHVIYTRKPDNKRKMHNIALNRLFTQKAAIWRKIRKNDPSSIIAQVQRSNYKAIGIRINSTVLSFAN